MDSTIIIVTALSFGLSFLFALGGIGSAIALVPVLHWYGIPLGTAKPTGLFVNTISMAGASYSNIKNKRLDFRMGIPLIVSSSLLAPLGAWSTTLYSANGCDDNLYLFSGFLSCDDVFFQEQEICGSIQGRSSFDSAVINWCRCRIFFPVCWVSVVAA